MKQPGHSKPKRERRPTIGTLPDFCSEFGVKEVELGKVLRLGRRYYLVNDDKEQLEVIQKQKKNIFAAGVYLGEEKERFEPSAALLEIIAARVREHKTIVDDKAAWLFLCGRDILDKGVVTMGKATRNGLLLVQNQQGENLGYGLVSQRRGNLAIRNVLDRGNFLRRERFE